MCNFYLALPSPPPQKNLSQMNNNKSTCNLIKQWSCVIWFCLIHKNMGLLVFKTFIFIRNLTTEYYSKQHMFSAETCHEFYEK